MMSRIAITVSVLAGLTGLCAPTANAAPIDPYCYDQRLCDGDFGDTYYCPDTGGFVGPFGACDALVTGPYAPGGLSPNEGSAGW